jgi:hypothetical protein
MTCKDTHPPRVQCCKGGSVTITLLSMTVRALPPSDGSSAYDSINGIAYIAAVAGGSATSYNFNIFAIDVVRPWWRQCRAGVAVILLLLACTRPP